MVRNSFCIRRRCRNLTQNRKRPRNSRDSKKEKCCMSWSHYQTEQVQIPQLILKSKVNENRDPGRTQTWLKNIRDWKCLCSHSLLRRAQDTNKCTRIVAYFYCMGKALQEKVIVKLITNQIWDHCKKIRQI